MTKIDKSEYTPKPYIKHKYFSYGSGYVAKRKARVEHECKECGCVIEINEECYVSTYKDGFQHFTKYICSKCWRGREMKAYNDNTYLDKYAWLKMEDM